jgi:hypothetical protein
MFTLIIKNIFFLLFLLNKKLNIFLSLNIFLLLNNFFKFINNIKIFKS